MSDEKGLIDTNVLVHAYVISDEEKHAIAAELVDSIWREAIGTIALQNLCEFFVVVTTRVERPMSTSRAKSIVNGIMASQRWRIIDRTSDTVMAAIDLVKNFKIPFWDALIAACMIEHEVKTIFTENERDFKKVRGITLMNPFAS
jgi:predicted nucleic acid-binding protein